MKAASLLMPKICAQYTYCRFVTKDSVEESLENPSSNQGELILL